MPTRSFRPRQKSPDVPCIVRNRVTGKWLVAPDGPSWSAERRDALLHPSRAVARSTMRTIGGAIPFLIEPATGDAR